MSLFTKFFYSLCCGEFLCWWKFYFFFSCKISPIKFKSWMYIFSPVFNNSVANGNVWLLLWSLGNVSGNSGNSGDSCQSSATGTGLASYLRKANFEDEYSQLYKNDLPFFSNNFLKAIISETHICWKWNYWHFILWEAYKFHSLNNALMFMYKTVLKAIISHESRCILKIAKGFMPW